VVKLQAALTQNRFLYKGGLFCLVSKYATYLWMAIRIGQTLSVLTMMDKLANQSITVNADRCYLGNQYKQISKG